MEDTIITVKHFKIHRVRFAIRIAFGEITLKRLQDSGPALRHVVAALGQIEGFEKEAQEAVSRREGYYTVEIRHGMGTSYILRILRDEVMQDYPIDAVLRISFRNNVRDFTMKTESLVVLLHAAREAGEELELRDGETVVGAPTFSPKEWKEFGQETIAIQNNKIVLESVAQPM